MNKPGRKRVLSVNDRRWPVERRQFSYTLHIPERRSGAERRGGVSATRVFHFFLTDKPERTLAVWNRDQGAIACDQVLQPFPRGSRVNLKKGMVAGTHGTQKQQDRQTIEWK